MTIVWGSYEPLNYNSNFPFFDRYTETEKARVDFDFPTQDEQVTPDNFYELALEFRDVAIEFVEHVQEQGKAPSSKALRNRIYADGNDAIGRLNTVLVDQTISMDEKIFETRSVIEDIFGMYVLLAAFAAEHPEYAPFFSFSRYDFETGATTDDATGQGPLPSGVSLDALAGVTFPKPQPPSMSFGTSTPRPPTRPVPELPALPLPGSGTEVVPDEGEPEEGGEENGDLATDEDAPKSNSMFAIGALAIAAGVLILTLNQKRR